MHDRPIILVLVASTSSLWEVKAKEVRNLSGILASTIPSSIDTGHPARQTQGSLKESTEKRDTSKERPYGKGRWGKDFENEGIPIYSYDDKMKT